MHQTFYIDIDEEITSIIERLKKARANEIIMVVPKRALLVQSIVNLRILKKEADEAGLQLMIVTQDKLGKILIEKAGIFVQQKMDNISDDDIEVQEEDNVSEESSDLKKEAEEFKKGKNRLDEIGSSSYFDDAQNINEEVIRQEMKSEMKRKKDGKEKLINRELVIGKLSDIKKSSPKKNEEAARINFPEKSEADANYPGASASQISADRNSVRNIFPSRPNEMLRKSFPMEKKDSQLESFFYQKNDQSKNNRAPKREFREISLSGKAHSWFWIFGTVAAVVAALILVYFFVPRAEVIIQAKTTLKSIDSEITGDTLASSVDLEAGTIPVKIIDVTHEIVKSQDSTGSRSVSNQKAHGAVTIYNEFDKNPQPLVATTRLLTEDGKLFRLVKGVTVPGMSEKDGQMQAGSVEAEVVADQSGEEFNIEPSKFKIPGFQNSGNEKYNKFYAESKEKMSGGGKGSNEAKFVTAADITAAKNNLVSEIDKELSEKIKEVAGEKGLLIEGAVKNDEPIYKLSNSEGDMADSFNITAQVSARAFVVDKEEFEKVVAEMISKASGIKSGIDPKSLSLDFGKPNVDFEKGAVDIKFHASGKVKSDLDLDLIREEITGKSEDDLVKYLSAFPDIEKVEVNYRPSFMNGRIPFIKAQVTVALDKE